MSSKDNQDSKRSKKDSELKNPGRREVLGVAVVAAAFTAGQVGSAEGQGKKKPPAKKPAAEPRPPHGGLVPPYDVPGAAGYGPVSTFHDLSAQLVYKDGADYRRKVSAYAKRLRQEMGLLDSEFRHVIRLEPRSTADAGATIGQSGHCSCCCC
jgi:hypothetical protein